MLGYDLELAIQKAEEARDAARKVLAHPEGVPEWARTRLGHLIVEADGTSAILRTHKDEFGVAPESSGAAQASQSEEGVGK